MKNKNYRVIGVMSGTSLDGLDLCLADFSFIKEKWKYKILKAKTIRYNKAFKQKLNNAPNLSGLELAFLSNEIAEFYAKQINKFLNDVPQKPCLIASHGQTIFHQPAKGLTFQIGNGAIIAAKTGITTVCDFRTIDVALGGQGAPLVPIGDKLLFTDYDACLNLGGFANITINNPKKFLAFDICPVNIVLNPLAESLGKPYDKDGQIAKANEPDYKLVSILNKIPFYKIYPPKSLGSEWVYKNISPLLNASKIDVPRKISTYTEHAAQQIAHAINKYNCKRVLVSGGGALNKHLINLIQLKSTAQLIIPDRQVLKYKEALVFGLLGLLRIIELPNSIREITGASTSSVGGAVYLGKQKVLNIKK